MNAISDRMRELNSQMGWEFTDAEQREIDGDAARSAEVLGADLRRPPLINENVLRGLALELIDKHGRFTKIERKVVHSMGTWKDLQAFRKASPRQQADALQLFDRPWRIGTRILVLYSANPRVIAPIETLEESDYVAEVFRSQCTRPPLEHCDVRISTRCKKPARWQIVHYKVGQYLCFHRVCERCEHWLMYGDTPAKAKRLEQLKDYTERD